MRRRLRVGALLLVIGLLAPGCGGGGDPRRAVPEGCPDLKAPPAVVTQPAVASSTLRESNLVFDVTSTAEVDTRVVVRLDGRLALDIRIAGTPQACGVAHHPIHRYYYRLPRGDVRMSVVTDGGDKDTTTVRIGARRTWSWMQIQPPFPAEITTQETAPGWG